jgi:carboxyl-terminal processing protease
MATASWESFSQSGTTAGYGAQFYVQQSTPPRKIVVALTEPSSPADTAGLLRGDEIVAIDNIDAVNSNVGTDVAALNEGLTPQTTGESHSFTIRRGSTESTVTMVSANVTSTPVQNVERLSAPNSDVGYLLFNDHIATAESELIAAVNTLSAAPAVTDLVLDIRYNGGGYLDIASELAYMIAGPARTAGMTFERITFNDKHTTTDPVTGAALTPTPFHTTTQGFSVTTGAALPTLNLSRVYVLTSGDTCSASEAVINSLRGVGVDVIQIGTTTCGKPYGFYATDNCGTTYFSIQFKGVNALGFGDYADGFSPENTSTAKGESVPGCSVADDFTHELGDPNEGMLKAALNFRSNPTSCPTPAAQVNRNVLTKLQGSAVQAEGQLLKPEWMKNRILRSEPQ